MFRQCFTLAVLGCALAAPQHQYQTQPQQDEGIPPHLLREYIGAQQPAQAQTQIIPRPAHLGGASAQGPARLPYQVQAENQYQARPQYQVQQQPQPQPQQQYRQQYAQEGPQRVQEDYDHNPSYQFGFDVNDDQYTNYQNRKEQRDGDVIKGSYSVVDSDGFVRTVTYTADPKEGFKAEVSRKPTDIVVKIPTPKPQILQSQISQQQPQISHQQPQISQYQQQQQPQHQHQGAPQYYPRYEQ
ncbi:putative cyclin-dependent serine/threonine-protein kinase DDB_G0272797/DDB_G0274007 [Battus philenor]|uniref:putative cyclin-dependent serine/threonine-protein kinase DDB_G0272797/DDB_G0274007 n=1 Tax=Battus philenor TaxID=42288 RepID=UPI0035CFFAE3